MRNYLNKTTEQDANIKAAEPVNKKQTHSPDLNDKAMHKSGLIQRRQQEHILRSPSVQQLQLAQQKIQQNSAPAPIQKKDNLTGLPNQLKAGLEHHSGLSMDDVRVHYNSPKPAQLQAHAYTQGADIHIGRGQEKHLAHEAWHVVQQKQGRVRPTLQFNGAAINDDKGLEKEADAMGIKVIQKKAHTSKTSSQFKQYTLANTGIFQLKLVWKAQALRDEQQKLYGNVDEALHKELVDKYNDPQYDQAVAELKKRRGEPAAQSGSSAVLTDQPKASSMKEIMGAQQRQQKSAPPPQPRTMADRLKASAASSSNPKTTVTRPKLASTVADPVPKYVQNVKEWNKVKDAGQKVQLTSAQLGDLLDQLAAITTSSGKNAAFNVGLSVGEEKYEGHVCVKVIAIYSKAVSQVTTHQPTYHFNVSNMTSIPEGLEDWDLGEK